MIKRFALLALIACAAQSHAQGPAASTPSPAKKELIQKLLTLQRPGLELLARRLVERPAAQMLRDAEQLLQTEVPAEKREEIGKAIEADVKKYVDETVPLVTERALKVAPTSLGVTFDEKFTEEELKQLLAWFESPVTKKYEQLAPQMNDAFVQKLLADVRDSFEPKIKTLQTTVGKRLGVGDQPAASPAATKPSPTKPAASAPAKKR